MYEPKKVSFKQGPSGITHWKSTGIDNYSLKTDLGSVNNSKTSYPIVSEGKRMSVNYVAGNYVKENKVIYPGKSVINIYIVYELDDRKVYNPDFTAQNCLFGAVKITPDVTN